MRIEYEYNSLRIRYSGHPVSRSSKTCGNVLLQSSSNETYNSLRTSAERAGTARTFASVDATKYTACTSGISWCTFLSDRIRMTESVCRSRTIA